MYTVKDQILIKGQLFARIPVGINTPNTYLVCGLIRTDKPIADESIHTLTGNASIIDCRNVKEYSRGSGLDGIMQTEIWNLNIKEEENEQ